MRFSERAPSSAWAALKYNGEALAEAWFKPEGDPLAVVFRVPQGRPGDAEVRRRLTIQALLRTVGVAAEEVEGWRVGDESDWNTDPTDPGLRRPLPLPPPGESDLAIHVRLKPPAPEAAPAELGESEVPPEKWQALDALWQAVLALEAGIAATRMSVDGLRAELESACRRSLAPDEKVNALQADVALWNKAKSRVHYTLPKLREFIHRATWATAAAERKRLEEVVKNHIEPRVPFPEVDRVREELEHLQKDRQVLSAQGNAVYQEGRGLAAEIQRTLGALQRNAADRARAKRDPGRGKGKFF
ncbi:MAG: hypothetical protein K2X87_34225 [Gemmataceae bacterium]|nr:hypothetical protein [Gemmataceae bacterium]